MNKLKRNFIKLLSGGAIASLISSKLSANTDISTNENTAKLNSYIRSIVGSRNLITNTKVIRIEAKPIYGSGDLISLRVDVNYPMISANRITNMYILSDGNENIQIAKVFFSPYNPRAYFSGRIKVQRSSKIVVLIENNQNKIAQAVQDIKISENA